MKFYNFSTEFNVNSSQIAAGVNKINQELSSDYIDTPRPKLLSNVDAENGNILELIKMNVVNHFVSLAENHKFLVAVKRDNTCIMNGVVSVQIHTEPICDELKIQITSKCVFGLEFQSETVHKASTWIASNHRTVKSVMTNSSAAMARVLNS